MIQTLSRAVIGLTIGVVTISGCTMHTQQVKPTPALIKQVGLPVYPNATPIMASNVTQASRLGHADSASVGFVTNDDITKVQAFYAKRVPANARLITIPMGFTTTVSYQWYEKDMQKQVLFERIKGRTIISLQSVKIGLPGQQSPPPSQGGSR